ncbi:hypothetical protein G5V57_27630 [Nordella sp. HKS 07]|uniref:adenylate/guanylate cyclase domain-containing protein n=1 Tax=Nordella sp. HKS 07 TaxID=2712222 RepID=UPI0013E118F3|nr:adenylate/guanylate cyclase domain-containing protein [Nordella sp. HKS 07]QIG51163.1 hypothetical protein G5V57_27630 [Nordella sp. HKS 07]
MRGMNLGVGAKLLTGLALLATFIVVSAGLAVYSFNQLHESFDRVASTQLATMVAAAQLRQESEILASLAPSLFAQDMTVGSLTEFSTKTFRLQSSLQKLIQALTKELGNKSDVSEIDRIAQSMFSNADRLATQIYGKATAQADMQRAAGQLAALSADSQSFAETLDSDSTAENRQLIRDGLIQLDDLNARAFRALGGGPQGPSPAVPPTSVPETSASAVSGLTPAALRLRKLDIAVSQVVAARERLNKIQVEIVELLKESDSLSQQLSERIQPLTQSIQADITAQNRVLGAVLGERSTIMLALGVLGLLLSAIIATYFQLSVIGRLNRLKVAVQRGSPTEATKQLLTGRDEIADMGRAVVNYVDEIKRRDEELLLIQSRLTNAIEAITDGFSLYDANDVLVTCNSRYRTLLYPDEEDLVRPGQSFETVIRRAAEMGMISAALSDREEWVASRLQSHRDPKGPTVQLRSDGTWIEIQEHKTESGDTVSVYTDVTERRQFIDRLLEAKQQAEQAGGEAAEKNRMLEALSNKLSKYLAPQVYSSIFSGRHSVEVSSTRKKLTIFFSDIAGFTETTDSLESEELTALLNRYLNEMSKIALQYGATIDKFIGDAIMVFFGDPETRGAKEDALACVKMAIAMQARMAELGAEWRDLGLENPFRLRIGINTGFCTVGNFGSEDRVDYTIIGGEVNLAARLQTHTEVGCILIAHETFSLVKDDISAVERPPISVKGFARPIRCYKVEGSYEDLAKPGAVVYFSGDAGTIALTLDRMDSEERQQLRKAAQTLLKILDRQD